MDNNPKIKNKSNNNTSVSSPSSANGNGSSPKIDGLAVAQKGLEVAEEIKNAKERIDEAVENGESEEQAVLDEGKNQVKNGISDATDYGIKKAREKIEKEFAKKQAQKKAAEEATKQAGKKAGEVVAKKGVESGTKAAGITAEKAAEAGAAEGVAAGTTAAGTTAAGTTTAGTTAAGATAAGATAGGATASTPVGWIVLIVIAAIILTIIMAVIIIFIIMGLFVPIIGTSFSTNDNYYACNDGIIVYDDTKSMEISVDTYLANQLHNIFTKIEYDESGNIIGYKPLYFNEDIYKATAIAKRSSILASTDADCSIYDPTYDIGEEIESQMPRSELLDAIIETKGRIISQNNNSGIINASLDYFCPQEKDDDDYYTLYQKDQLIPKNWINNNNLMPNEWKQGNCISYYGMSLYGALYLSQEKGYDYGEIIKYYFDDTSIGESIPFTSPVTGDIKNTAGASNKIDVPIGQFLSSRGSSLNELNNYIESSVNQAGRGTREGVVAAAVSLINFLYDKFDAKLPYYWGGKYAGKGIPSFFGEYDPQGHISRNGYVFHIKSFDCSGFVQWAIINGGFSNPGTGTGYFAQAYGANSCNISLVNCVGVPGDLINSPNGHVQLIIAVDNNGGNYVVAESTTTGVVIQYRGMHKNNSNGTYKILHMDRFYGQ